MAKSKNVELAPPLHPHMGILLKCISKAAENVWSYVFFICKGLQLFCGEEAQYMCDFSPNFVLYIDKRHAPSISDWRCDMKSKRFLSVVFYGFLTIILLLES